MKSATLGQATFDGEAHRVRLVPEHADDPLRAQPPREIDRILDHRPTGDPMPDLGATRLHARTQPGGQDHGGERRAHGLTPPLPIEGRSFIG